MMKAIALILLVGVGLAACSPDQVRSQVDLGDHVARDEVKPAKEEVPMIVSRSVPPEQLERILAKEKAELAAIRERWMAGDDRAAVESDLRELAGSDARFGAWLADFREAAGDEKGAWEAYRLYVDGTGYNAGDKVTGVAYAKAGAWAERFGTPEEVLYYWRKAAGEQKPGDREGNLPETWDENNLDHLKAAFYLRKPVDGDTTITGAYGYPNVIEALKYRPDWPAAWLKLANLMDLDPKRSTVDRLRAHQIAIDLSAPEYRPALMDLTANQRAYVRQLREGKVAPDGDPEAVTFEVLLKDVRIPTNEHP